MSWHAAIHGFAPMIGFSALIVAFLVYARYFAAAGERGAAIGSGLAGLVVLGLFVRFNLTMDLESGVIDFGPLWAAMVIGFGSASAVAGKVRALQTRSAHGETHPPEVR